ncbi:hypothetical protein [Micromonospora nigra]|uniref:hypothetical protein n=1 Tax=Micromonospora nigra TaxID=145857 RepID=UPI001112C93E|nr:hypothetical protein [Micromonospora nigra]
MDVSSAPARYAEALLFAAEVVDAATRPPHGDHGEEVLRDPYAQKLLRHQSDWSWCDNRQDVDLAAGGALRATVEYVARRHATALPDHTGRAAEHWPDVDDRLARLASALRFAAEAAEQAWPHRLGQVLAPWVRQRLAGLLATTGRAEGLGSLDARVRRAIVLAWQYRSVRHELFADHHWQGRPPAPWWCLDGTIAARSPFDGYATGQVPSYALHLTHLDHTTGQGEGELTVAHSGTAPLTSYPVTITHRAPTLTADVEAVHRAAVADALSALGLTHAEDWGSTSSEPLDRC